MVKTQRLNTHHKEADSELRQDNQPMPKQVSALNTFLLVSYIRDHYPEINLHHMIEAVRQKGPLFIENLKTGHVEPISLEHLSETDYWFSNRFMIRLYDEIQSRIPDPELGYRIGKTAAGSENIFRTAIGIPLLGPYRLLKRITRENKKYNRTKTNRIIKEFRPGGHPHYPQ